MILGMALERQRHAETLAFARNRHIESHLGVIVLESTLLPESGGSLSGCSHLARHRPANLEVEQDCQVNFHSANDQIAQPFSLLSSAREHRRQILCSRCHAEV
jgi:hypothetical protein